MAYGVLHNLSTMDLYELPNYTLQSHSQRRISSCSSNKTFSFNLCAFTLKRASPLGLVNSCIPLRMRMETQVLEVGSCQWPGNWASQLWDSGHAAALHVTCLVHKVEMILIRTFQWCVQIRWGNTCHRLRTGLATSPRLGKALRQAYTRVLSSQAKINFCV